MKKKNKGGLRIFVIIVVFAVLFLGYLNLKNPRNEVLIEKEQSTNINAETPKISGSEMNTDNGDTGTVPENKESANAKNAEGTEQVLAKSLIMNYISKNIETIAPSAPSSGAWKVTRFWFTSNKDAYVEYSSDGEIKQVLVSVEGDNNNPVYRRKAAFDSGESSWVITEGKDSEFGKDRELYEKAGEQWEKKN